MLKQTSSTLLFLIISILYSETNAQISKNVNKYTAYLFAYFEGSGKASENEQIRFAVSPDAVTWTALNDNRPIIPSDKISQTGGVRDPHLLRGNANDGFFMVATDMNVAKNGWDNNPGIVMMKSVFLHLHLIVWLTLLKVQQFQRIMLIKFYIQ